MAVSCVATLALFGTAMVVESSHLSQMEALECHGTLYEEFRQKYRKTHNGTNDPVSYAERLDLFSKRHDTIAAHNADPTSSWVAEVNHFADYTDNEFVRLLNYRRTSDFWSGPTASRQPSSFLEQREQPVQLLSDLAEEADWRSKMPASLAEFYDQGSCGSCWATAAATVIQMHAELNKLNAPKLSYEQITSCTANPKHCGGDGGCKGATSSLALEYVKNNVLAPFDKYPKGYQHGGDSTVCNVPQQSKGIKIGNFMQLAENEYAPLVEALANKGPVVVSVDGSGMSGYKSGVYDSCGRNAVTNHAVVAVGYGKENDKKYWLIRNSWGSSWGMEGFMHMERHDPRDTGNDLYCGTDMDAQAGVGCQGDKKEVPVCGMCGVLSHGVYPQDVSEADIPAPKQ